MSSVGEDTSAALKLFRTKLPFLNVMNLDFLANCSNLETFYNWTLKVRSLLW